jgi:hypothetical protein
MSVRVLQNFFFRPEMRFHYHTNDLTKLGNNVTIIGGVGARGFRYKLFYPSVIQQGILN